MAEGLILGFLTWLSYCFSFVHFPNFLKKLLLKSFFVTDIISVAFTFLLMTSISKSVIAVIASIICGLLVNLTLMIYSHFYSRHSA